MLTLYWACEPDLEKDFEFRVNYGTPTVGEFVWMDPDNGQSEWQIIATHLFQSPDSDMQVCIAEVSKTPKAKADLPECVHFYLLDQKYYTVGLAGGCNEIIPEVGPFEEYEDYTCRLLPITKVVTHYETLQGDDSCRVYVAYLQPVLVPVAA